MRARILVASLLLACTTLASTTAAAQAAADVAVWAGGPASEEGLATLASATLQARGYAVRDPAQVAPLASTLFSPGTIPTSEQASALAAALGVSRLFVIWSEPVGSDRVTVRVITAPGTARGHITVPAAEARIGLARLMGQALESGTPAQASGATSSAGQSATAAPPRAGEPQPIATATAGVASPDQAAATTEAVEPVSAIGESSGASFVRSQDLDPARPERGWNGGRRRDIVTPIVAGAVVLVGGIVALIGASMLTKRDTEDAGIGLTILGSVSGFVGLILLPISLAEMEGPGNSAESGARFGSIAPSFGLTLSGSF